MTRPALLVSVGTDHHRFDRLIRWTDAWVETLGFPVDYTVQHGASTPSRLATNLSIVPREELLDRMQAATLVVTQGGPGSIVDARACGRIPIVVPRLQRYGEVVDDHQVPFCALMARQGACLVAGGQSALHAWLDLGLADPHRLISPAPDSPAPVTAQAIRRQLGRVTKRRSGWIDLGRMREVWLRRQPGPWLEEAESLIPPPVLVSAVEVVPQESLEPAVVADGSREAS
ncbi:MAG: glycosyl transferase [Austwickia sp.]|nr:glycosyl transferase [Austwickia sp.]MBK8436176.1 glycosyl transferase [Austwickia sp.]MBK9101857.1 glycosyl transferase [Austwickia sp.]